MNIIPTLHYSFEFTAPDGDTDYTVTLSDEDDSLVKVSSVVYETRDDSPAARLELRIANATHFYDQWDLYNPFAVGAVVVWKVDGIKRMTAQISEANPAYGSLDRSMVLIAYDKMWATKDAVVEMTRRRKVIRERVNLTRVEDSLIFECDADKYPWAEEFTPVPVWVKEPKDDGSAKSYRVFPTEYQAIFDRGFIVFNYDELRVVDPDEVVDPDGDGDVVLDDYDTEIWAEIVYYDDTDESTKVSTLLTDMFVYDSEDGGLGWVEDTDFSLEDTPQDILNRIDHHTKSGDSDLNVLISNLYDDPDWAVPRNYWIRDFNGTGFVTGKYVFQQSGLVFNGDFNLDPAIHTAGNWAFNAAIWTWGASHMDKDADGVGALEQQLYAIEGDTYSVKFTISNWTAGDVTPELGGTSGDAVNADGTYIQYIACGADGDTDYTKTLEFVPSNAARFRIDDVMVQKVPKDIDTIMEAHFPVELEPIYSKAILVNNNAEGINITRDVTPDDEMSGAHGTTEIPDATFHGCGTGTGMLVDGRGSSSWGYFKCGSYAPHTVLPQDQELVSFDLGEELPIDRAIISVQWTFNRDAEGQLLVDGTTKKEVAALYRVLEPQRITVEGNTSTGGSPDEDGWYALCEDLYFMECTPGEDERSWKARDGVFEIKSIGAKSRYIRVVVNNPMFATVSDHPYRAMIWWLSDIAFYSDNYLRDADGELPYVEFVNADRDENRWMFDMKNTIVDMYRPELFNRLYALYDDKHFSLAHKTLIVENNRIFDFQTKIDDDPENVSIGYKYLVSRLDAASRENSWVVRISPRPDIIIGDTVYSSALNSNKYFLVHGSRIEITASRVTQTLTLSDHDADPD